MTLKAGLIGGLIIIVLLAVGIPLLFHYLDMKEIKSAYRTAVEEGFELVEKGIEDPEALDGALKKGLSARKIFPEGQETALLLGRTYYLKKKYNKAVEELEGGLEDFDDVDLLPEFYYHLGLSYANLYEELHQQELWDEALADFSKAASSSLGRHRPDSYFGIAMLYLIKFKEVLSRDYREKAVINLKRGIELEGGREGYVDGEPGSPCPFCGMVFKRKSDDPQLQEILKKLDVR